MQQTHAYQKDAEKIETAESWTRIHGNGEQTRVAILDVGVGFVAVAVDIDPRTYQPVDAELVAYDPTLPGAEQRAERWLQSHAKGVSPGDGGSGLLSAIWGGLKKLDQSATADQDGESA